MSVFNCFGESTKVVLSEDRMDKKVKDVVVGDWLFGCDEASGELACTKVHSLDRERIKFDFLSVVFSNSMRYRGRDVINCTPHQKFWVDGKWVEARDLQPKDKIKAMHFRDKYAFLAGEKEFKEYTVKVKDVVAARNISPVSKGVVWGYGFECRPHNNFYVALSQYSHYYILSHR